ncbi:MAG: DUF4832 domain-containing protein [Paludibacteraceae bacterium]|nr:DUF4832 domain-containing protein [Paludibacteraceae bacterium]
MNKIFSIVSLLLVGVLSVHAIRVSYTTDNISIFKNPERGYTEEISARVSEKHPNVVKGNMDKNWGSNEKMTLAMVLYNFRNFKSDSLPQVILNGFDEDMQILRDCGVKCVLRFAYTESQSDNVDATPEWARIHMEQLSQHLKDNADVIYVIEAGFIGSWGEWYYSSNYGNKSMHMNDKREQIIDYLFQYMPEDRFILFRYPMIKTEYLKRKGINNKALSPEEGFSGTVKARMGCHNDAFLNSWGNDGTYASNSKDDDPQVRRYIADETLYVPNGGETNVEDDSYAQKVYKKGPEEMSEYHWSFCGKSYATQVTSRWRKDGLFDVQNRFMGYRYNLLYATYSDQAAPGGKANITISISNSGCAPLYNERTAYIVMANNEHTYRFPLQTDPRRWLPRYEVSLVREQIELPDDMQEGTYRLYLWMPDKYTSLQNDPRFSIRVANKNLWNPETGLNDLGADIVITKDAPLDPGEPESIENVCNSHSQQARKEIRNGRIYITTPDGTTYDALGQQK